MTTNPRRFLERGQAMIMATVFFVLLTTTILLGLGTMVASSQRLLSRSTLSEEAFYLAEAGAETAAYEIMHSQFVGPASTLYGTEAQVDVAVEGDNQRVTSTGTLDGATRVVEVLIFASSTDSRILSWKETQ